ncbi:nucleolar protein 12-domain-containing protein [Schizophyllum fasciatum]
MSNLDHLTRAHQAVAAKRRAKKNQVKEIVFDDAARRDFLTGFHKRKVARTDAARKKAMEREKQQRLETRREQRQILREQAAENAANVEAAYGALINGEDSDELPALGPSGRAKGKQREEFEDEETLATVTVVEDFDPDTLIHGAPDETRERPSPGPSSTSNAPAKVKPPAKKITLKKASKPKKIKYETNAARKAQTAKQRARHTEKAELAGGKRAQKNKKRR